MSRFLLLLMLLSPLCSDAQFTYALEENVPVQDANGNPLRMPWAGGLNAAHYNVMDLNNDGKDDLVLFDRTAGKVITFLNENNQYVPAPAYESFFPDDITNWLLLRDANCDGRKDIFTGNNLGIKVYMNVTAPGETLTWKHVLFYTEDGGSSQVLLTKGFNDKVNLQLQFDDLPAIVDADGDGDLDIFNVRFVGNGTVEYHQNFSVERYGTCDSLDFVRITQKWGDFTECNCGNFAFNGSNCPPITGGRTQHAGGKSLLAFDADGDSKLDLLFSEATCSNLFFLKNQGTLQNPIINASSAYPPSTPANFLIFPAAFYEDLDFDGRKDLLSIPNIFTKTFLNSNLANSNWFYKNTGTTASPNFAFSQNNFLQDEMIDVGDNAVPAFVDYDGDSDYDMFISQNTSDNTIAKVRLFENTGTVNDPQFKLANSDIFGFSQSPFYNLKIQFADINADAKMDLVFTATSLQTGLTKLYYLPGTGNGVLDFAGQSLQTVDFPMSATENIFVTDINKDGLPDLLVGRVSGALEYWRNNGGGMLSFSLDDNTYLGLGPTVLRQNISCAVADFDGNGKTDLVYADQNGRLSIISDFREATDVSGAITNLTFNTLSETYESKNLGGRLWPTDVNLFNTTKPAIVVGNVLGGISILRHDEGRSLPENPVIDIYPNPVAKQTALTVKTDRPAFVQFFSVMGQELTKPVYIVANEEYSYKLFFAAGTYILRFTVDNKVFAKRIVIY